MHITVIPPAASGRFPFALKVIGEPAFEWARGVGFAKADIPCVLTDAQREWIRGASVQVFDPDWFGVVWEAPSEDGILHVIGHGAWASMSKREALYVATDLSKWRGRENGSGEWTSAYEVQVTPSGALTIMGVVGTPVTNPSYRGAVLRFPATSSVSLSFGWVRTANTYGLTVYTGIPDGSAEGIAWTNRAAAVSYGTGANSGTFNLATYAGSGMEYVLLGMNSIAAGTQVGGEGFTFTNLKVYGVSGVTSTTAYNVLANALSTLSAAALPAGAAYLANVAAPAGELADLYLEPDKSAADVIAKVAAAKDHEFGWYPGRVGDITRPLPFFFPRPTTPAYLLDCSKADTSGLSSEDMEGMASVMRGRYTDASGAARYVDVADANMADYLVRAGIVKMEVVDCGTTDLTSATGIATASLSPASRDRMSGSLICDDLRTIGGSPVSLDTVKCGEVVRLLNVRGRPWVDASIDRLKYAGGSWSMDVDAAYRLATALAGIGASSSGVGASHMDGGGP